MVEDIIYALIKKGAHITLYIQNPETAEKNLLQDQVFRISQIKNLPDNIRTEINKRKGRKNIGSLNAYYYDPPASLRVIKLDNKVLVVGWYIYSYVKKGEQNRYKRGDPYKLEGHDKLGKILYFGNNEFHIMSDLVSDLLKNFEKDHRKPVISFP